MSCVYFIRHYGTTPVKVGASKYDNPASRVQDFEVGSPFGIELLGFIKSKDAFGLERKIHAQLQSKSIKGEWYDISTQEVNSIIDRYTGNLELSKLSHFLSEQGILPSEAIRLIRKYSSSYKPEPQNKETSRKRIVQTYEQMVSESSDEWVHKAKLMEKCMKSLSLSRAQVYRVFDNSLFETRKIGRSSFLRLATWE